MKKRPRAKTAMNISSSRSHAIFTLVIQQMQRKAVIEVDTRVTPNGAFVVMKTSNIHFVDLAGTERIQSPSTPIKNAMMKGKRYILYTSKDLIPITMINTTPC